MLQTIIPEHKLRTADHTQRKALRRMMFDRQVALSRTQAFLLEAIPLVAQPVSPVKRQMVERRIIALNDAHQLPKSSLVVIALLSCLYDHGVELPKHAAARPGRAVLKPKMNYTAADAYNAFVDIQHLETLLNLKATLPDVDPVLYTRDVGLASVWTALLAREVNAVKKPNGRYNITYTFDFSPAMLPAMSREEQADLAQRLRADRAS